MWHAWQRAEIYTGFWWESPKERDHLEARGRRSLNGIRMDLTEIGWGGGVWIGFTWLRMGPLADCCECGDEPAGSGATEFVS
jgi:hypothetical protein